MWKWLLCRISMCLLTLLLLLHSHQFVSGALNSGVRSSVSQRKRKDLLTREGKETGCILHFSLSSINLVFRDCGMYKTGLLTTTQFNLEVGKSFWRAAAGFKRSSHVLIAWKWEVSIKCWSLRTCLGTLLCANLSYTRTYMSYVISQLLCCSLLEANVLRGYV